MKDEAWIRSQIADLKGGIDELQAKILRNQGAILAYEACLADDSTAQRTADAPPVECHAGPDQSAD